MMGSRKSAGIVSLDTTLHGANPDIIIKDVVIDLHVYVWMSLFSKSNWFVLEV